MHSIAPLFCGTGDFFFRSLYFNYFGKVHEITDKKLYVLYIDAAGKMVYNTITVNVIVEGKYFER